MWSSLALRFAQAACACYCSYMNATATRSATALTVTLPDGSTQTLKGKRAASAAAVSFGRWANGVWTVSLHSTIAAAYRNARTYGTPHHAGGDYWRDADALAL